MLNITPRSEQIRLEYKRVLAVSVKKVSVREKKKRKKKKRARKKEEWWKKEEIGNLEEAVDRLYSSSTKTGTPSW